MSDLGIVWQIASRELRERGRSKAYLITSLVTAILVVGLILVPRLLSGGTDEFDVGSVGSDNEAIIESAVLLANANDEPDAEPSIAIATVEFADRETAEVALEEREIHAILVDGSEVIVESVGGFGESQILSYLQQGAASVELEAIVAAEGDVAA
ncbi:MAG TPA: hypothetical protein VFL72_03780, partial [Acidimicrobiia bacterium]|nr:hypothetical protein [Acidimicrobiia bacterium]